MRKLLWLFLCASLWAQDPTNANVIVVGNRAQPVQFTHESNIQNAISRAGTQGIVIIPADYRFPAETFTNPNSILIIDLRKQTLGVNGNGLEIQTGNLLLDYSAVVGYFTNSANGTICNELAKIDLTGGGFNGKVTTTVGAESANLIIGVAELNCGTTGVAGLAISGQTTVIFDTANATVGDFVGVSNTAGLATDLGTAPTTGTLGTIILSPSGALPSGCNVAPGCYVQLGLGGSGGSGGGNPNALVKNPAIAATNSVQPTATGFPAILQKCPAGAAATDLCADVQDSAGNHVFQVQQNGQAKLGGGTTKSISSTVSANSDLDGSLTMSGGTATYTFTGTYASHPTCTASDETNIAAVKVTYTGTTSVTFTTAGATDVVDYHCLGRN